MISGFVAGFVATLATHPLDYYKIQKQIGGTFHMVNAGSGGVINPVVYGIHYEMYFRLYNELKPSLGSFQSAVVSQGVCNVVLNPLWIIRTKRMAYNLSYPSILSMKPVEYTKGINGSHLLCLQSGISFFLMENLHFENPLVNSMVARVISNVITYPLDTLRTLVRVNTDKPFTTILKNSLGWNLYSGLVAHTVKSVPSFMIVNYIYARLN